jgi:16S rRNA (guanine527-N7)-methyltransferase
VDSIGKKLKVVEAVRDAVGLKNISTQHGRAEEIKNRKFDCVVSRAVAPLKDLWAWSRPLLRKAPRPPGGVIEVAYLRDAPPRGLICLKGGDLSAEISESGCRPRIMEIHEIFPLDYFKEKYLLYTPLP